MSVKRCGKSCCDKVISSVCSDFHKENYCSLECQKSDWKIHKILCKYIKKNSELLSWTEVKEAISKLREKAKVKDIKGTTSETRMLIYYLHFA
jgi:hypothetical protein